MLYVNPVTARTDFRGDPADLAAFREQRAFQELERIFLYQLVREMRKNTEKGLFVKSREREFFEDIFSDHLAGVLAESDAFGLATQMQAQLDTAQGGERPSKTSSPAMPLIASASPERSVPARAVSAHVITIPRETRKQDGYGHERKEQRMFADI